MADTSLKYFTQILSVISEFNISEEDCLRAAGLSEHPKSERVQAGILNQVLNYSAASLDDYQLGMKCGLKYPILQYTRPAEFLKLCANIKHAADIYNHYCPLFHTIGKPSGVISENGYDRMIWVPSIEPSLTEDYRQLIELIITNFVTSINWLAWKTKNAVKRVNIKHEAILPIEQYAELFDCEIKFGQEEYSLILQDGVKDAPFATFDQKELTRVCSKFDMALNELLEPEHLIARTELQIRRSIESGSPSKASIAKALGTSERTLARDLKSNGTYFTEIKHRVLKDLAVAKINQGLPLIEVAHSLGYNDQAAFTRAYKKWFGSPPGKHNASKNNKSVNTHKDLVHHSSRH